MKKLIYPDSNSELFSSLDGVMVSVIRDTNFYSNIKKASSSAISRQLLEDCKPDKDHFLIHITAIGDDETYGFNKNADGFPKKANEKYYKTFETNANLFREHNSSSPENRIGIIKAAAYNKDMHRIEVVAWANIKKAAAEYEAALAGKPLSSSMGASVPCDRDNISGKLSKNPSEYEPWMKRFPGKYIEEWNGKPINKWAYVHNDTPTFFDLSIVAKPADRIADYLEYRFNDAVKDGILKSACENDACVPSALLPEMMGYDLLKFGSDIIRTKGDLTSYFASEDKAKILEKLASIEKEFIDINSSSDKANDPRVAYIKNAKYVNFDKSYTLSKDDISELRNLRPETLFFELQKRASVLSFKPFVDLIFEGNPKFASEDHKNKIVKYAEIAIVPTVFSEVKNLIESGDVLPCGDGVDELFEAGDPIEAMYDLNNTDPVQKIMDGIEDQLSYKEEKKQPRIIQITITQHVPDENIQKEDCGKFFKIKTASFNPNIELSKDDLIVAKQLAFTYAFYKVAALHDMATYHFKNNLPEIVYVDAISQNCLAI
jgi:hypothetical protein|nr:MAG TPA: hypothetical protein [Caudoviricetes sp.]